MNDEKILDGWMVLVLVIAGLLITLSFIWPVRGF